MFVRTTNNVPIFGTELFFLRDGIAMANVPASSLPSPVTYTPPRTEPTDARSIHVELLGPVTLNLGNELTIVTYLADASGRVISSTTSPFAIRITAQVVNGVSEITDVLHTTITPGDGLAS